MTRRLNIAIATAGRFHVLDLARELHALGHHVRFYSYVPRARARRFGLPDECHVSLLPLAVPAVAWRRLMPRLMPKAHERVLYALLNRGVMMRLRPCDVFICMSGIYLDAARFAKERYGAAIWLERGSRHILSQDEILAGVPGAERPSPLTIRRELAGYALADRVVIPSHHVAESFRPDRSAYAKLFYNPYGVDLAMFPLRREKAPAVPFMFLFVGTWSLQKGCDLLAEAVRRASGVRLTHVGAIGDLDFPTGDDRFVHVGPVPQPELARFYAAADVFVLASRQEGFGVVLSQALASGLPVICTDRTGGPDLAHTAALAARITIVPTGDLDALTHAIAEWCSRLRAFESFSLLYVGSWSLRKGCDILTKAVKQVAGVRLTHVGAIGDCEFPAGHSQFSHVDPVPQPELATVYSEADLFILASREEGLSTVLIQALASGLPLVCTERTGGADLAVTPALAARITVVPHEDVGALACAIAGWRDRRLGGERLPQLPETDRAKLSWAAYARRYSDELLSTKGSGEVAGPMLGLLVIWAALLLALVVFAVGRPGRGGALTLAYFLGLSLIHVPGVLPFLGPDSGLADWDETQLGFETTILGMAAFVTGAIVARRTYWRHAPATPSSNRRRAQAFQHSGRRALVLGAVAYFVLIPLTSRIPSLTSIVSPLGSLLILGFWLVFYGAVMAADRRAMLAALALLPLLPLATLVAGGFLGSGIYWVLSVVAFLFVLTRRRTWFYVAALPVVFLGLSLFVTYMGQRVGIREELGEGQAGLLDRLDRDSSIITKFELFDLSSPDQVTVLDARLNQNVAVGAGVINHEAGGAPFAYGATVPPWALIPRAIWPNKPAVGGGGSIVSDFIDQRFAEGTSVGAGQVLEFYINFGIPGVLAGFLGLGYLLMRLDQGIMSSLAADDMRGLLLRAMPGLMLLQPGGNLLEILVGCVAAYVSARLLISLRFFDVPPAPRPRRQTA